ncbi:hypothetical protein ATEIFO6365_0003093700 [Aspergillus terreus]|uniref:Uncharacterized protein n=1 Tax=Aspergillus terreus TaxID=33178 RepID=A0A5M3YTA9_ASPTE|nr:hypothetical protein ATETN484_0003088300 [Aspergillus terreus]GFF14869.1 hypothetical protein ATEIFO6365_0003093700 [Aspergillus terreus]
MYSILEYRQKNSNYEPVDIRHSNKPRTRGPHLACRACHSTKCTYPKSKRPTRNSETPVRTTTTSIGSSQPSASHGATPPLPNLSTLAENRLDDDWQNMSSWLLDAWSEANARVGLTPDKLQTTDERLPPGESLQERRVPVRTGSIQAGSGETIALAPLDKNRNTATGWNPLTWSTFGESRAELAEIAGSRDHIQSTNPQHMHHLHDYDVTTMLSVSDLLPGQNDHHICPTDIQRVPSVMTVDSTNTSSNSQGLESQQLLSPRAPRPISASVCSCSCVSHAFQALGDLQVIESKFPPTGFDNHLNFMKRSLDQSFNLMDSICERLVLSFEAWARQYQGRSAMKVGKNPDVQGSQPSLHIFFGAYEISRGDEQCSILRALAMVQLRRLNLLIGRMRDVAVLQAWTDRKAVLESFLSRTGEAASTLIGRF